VEIAAIGTNEQGLAVGDRCAVEPYLYCGKCIACRNGRTNCCTKLQCLGVHVDGGMRELITIPISNLHRSKVLSLEQLALVETLGIGAHAVQRAAIQPGETVLVIGAGPIGLSVVRFAQVAGAEVIVLDVNESRLNFCRQQLKVKNTILESLTPSKDCSASEGTQARLSSLTHGDMPTTVFDATGNSESMTRAFGYIASSGRLIFVGLYQGDYTFNDPDFHRRELTLRASRNCTSHDFRQIIQLMENGEIDTRPWISQRVGCDDLAEQFPNWLEPRSDFIKAMVEF
jgi:2-desacetyl-2-hydroxyethyl bacteriochlorophyllide A dehydrogenase